MPATPNHLFVSGNKGKERLDENILDPVILVLTGQYVVNETTGFPVYYADRDVTSLKQGATSVKFERACEENQPEHVEDELSFEHIFYLAHPAGAQDRKGVPDYYVTSVSSQTVGNIYFETSKSPFQRPEFRAFRDEARSAWSKPLFTIDTPQRLFTAKSKWPNGRYRWVDVQGRDVALEDSKGDEHKLDVVSEMTRSQRDALVALWILRLWHATAESSQARREALERLTPASAGYPDIRLAKRVGALSGFAAGGGAGA